MRELFASDPHRFEKFSVSFNSDEIFLDYAKNILTEKVFSHLMDLIREVRIYGDACFVRLTT